MEKLKIILLLSGLFLNLIPSSAQYSLTIDEARKIFHIALTAQKCDSLAKYQEQEIQRGIKLQAASDSLNQILSAQVSLIKAESQTNNALYQNSQKQVVVARKKTRTLKWMAFGIFILYVIDRAYVE